MGLDLLQGDTALITGAAGGIGRAIATALAREGARVVLADIDAQAGEAAAAALRAEGCDARFIAVDLASRGAAPALFDAAVAALGRLTILVHSASPKRDNSETALSVSMEAWDRMVDINLRSGFELGQRAGNHMKAGGLPGRILYVTSLHAYSPRNLPHYSASKGGMTMVMKELARALAPDGIRVNAIAPGAIAGGGFKPDPAMAERIPMGRMGSAEDVAKMAVAVLCDRFAGYVTGTTIAVDGGIALYNWLPTRI